MSIRKIPQSAVSLVKRFEGFSATPYLCPAGVLTIGYGTTGIDVKKGMRVTEAEAEALLMRELRFAGAAVLRLIKVPLTDNQYAALVSFVYNLGGGRLQQSTLRMKINRGDHEAVPRELMRWVNAGGRKLSGLVKRREAEGNLYKEPDAFL